MKTLPDITSEQINKIQEDFEFADKTTEHLINWFNTIKDVDFEIGIAIIDFMAEQRKEDNVRFLSECIFK